jgi:hypothetical protein
MIGNPSAIESDQPRNMKAMALARVFSGTISETVLAASGV